MRQTFCAAAATFLLSFSNVQAQTVDDAPAFSDPEAQALYDADPATYIDAGSYAIQWSPVSEKEVVWRKRVWRIIDVADAPNNLLQTVSGEGFTSVLLAAVQAGQAKAYSNANDYFTRAITPDEASALAAAETAASASQASRYLLKEDWLYLSDGRGLSGRTIGIAPLAAGPADADIASMKTLFWIYYPELRTHLRTQAAGETGVQNLDEWFESRRYASTIVKVSDMPLKVQTGVYRKK